MQRLIAIVCLTLFVALFLGATVLYFNGVVTPAHAQVDSIIIIGFLAVAAGILLSQVLYGYQLIPIEPLSLRLPIGAAFGVLLFSIIFFAEHVMTTIQLTRAMRAPEVFSVVKGHCGIYSGRGLVRWYQLSLDPTIENRMEAFLSSNKCRIEHFLDLRNRQQLPCNAQEDQLGCLTRWMETFSKKGFWNISARKMFFEEAQKGVIKRSEEGSDKKWVSYALRDQDLESSRPTLLQQAGIDEDFNDVHHYFKIRDEFENLNLTKAIFSKAETFLADEKSPSADVVKFKELRKEVNLKLEKLPELEESLKIIQTKINYNPSL